jgi:O-antigen ligase
MIWLLGGYMWLFIHRPFEVWPILGELHLERIYMIVTIGCWLLFARKSWTQNPLNPAFLVFSLVMTASFFQGPYYPTGDEGIEGWFKVATFYVLCMSVIQSERDLKRMVLIFLGAIALYMTHSLWEYCNGRHMWAMGTYRMMGVDTLYGDPNSFAPTIVYAMPLALAAGLQFRIWWQRALLGGYLSLSMLCILLTGSRTAFIGLCFLVLGAALLSKRRLAWILLLGMLAPVAFQCLPQDRQNRFLTLIDPSYGPANAQESAEGRAKGWHYGVELWKEHPVLGVGPGAFQAATGWLQAHHLYGQILGELGTLGALAFAGILAAFAANALRAYRLCRDFPEVSGGFPCAVVWATSGAVLLLLLLGFGGHNLYRYTWLWYGAFQAIALHCMHQEATMLAGEATGEDEEENELA